MHINNVKIARLLVKSRILLLSGIFYLSACGPERAENLHKANNTIELDYQESVLLSTFKINDPVASNDIEKAAKGDAAASGRLAVRYAQCLDRRGIIPGIDQRMCLVLLRVWSTVDAENGGPFGTSHLARILSNSSNCADLNRSVFWYDRLKKIDSAYNYEDSENSVKYKIKKLCH